MKASRPWLRRLAAHLTTPFVVALGWELTIESPSIGDFWGAIALCYGAWLMVGGPGVLFRRSRPMRPWAYPVIMALFAAVPLSLTGAGWRSGDWSLYTFVPIFALAGAWYWLCAYWQPSRSDAMAVESS